MVPPSMVFARLRSMARLSKGIASAQPPLRGDSLIFTVVSDAVAAAATAAVRRPAPASAEACQAASVDVKVSVYPIQIWTKDWKPEYAEALKNAGLKEMQAEGNLKTVFGSCGNNELHKIAALPFVRQIVPIGG